jgi:hypothetical protein
MLVNLGEQYFSGYFPDPNESIEHLKAPLVLVGCNQCSLVQLRDSFSLSQMYGQNYGYRSGLNSTMIEHLRRKALKLIKEYRLNSSSKILDIGANDGTFLKNFSKIGSKLTGIDPTIPNWIEFYDFEVDLIDQLFNEAIFKTKQVDSFDLISSISMFYDVARPIEFAKLIKKLLSPSGIWHIELAYLPFMIENNSYDTICHEHLEYYSISSLQFILQQSDLKIVSVDFNHVNGGSIALDITHSNSKFFYSKYDISAAIKNEEPKINVEKWDQFQKSIENNIKSIKNGINDIASKNHKIIGIGASTKGNVILQAAEMNAVLIKFIEEINPRKYGKVTPGTKIPIKAEKESQIDSIKYKMVLPWHFKDHIVDNEKVFLNNGGKLIFPLPKFEII